MPTRWEVGPERKGERAAERRFPAQSAEIQGLISASDRFREMCDDLASVEEGLAATERLPENLRNRRRAEYEGMVEALTKEIEHALFQAKVVPISRAPKR